MIFLNLIYKDNCIIISYKYNKVQQNLLNKCFIASKRICFTIRKLFRKKTAIRFIILLKHAHKYILTGRYMNNLLIKLH